MSLDRGAWGCDVLVAIFHCYSKVMLLNLKHLAFWVSSLSNNYTASRWFLAMQVNNRDSVLYPDMCHSGTRYIVSRYDIIAC